MNGPTKWGAVSVEGAKWRQDFCCCAFGSVNVICVCAWALFLLMPGIFFVFAGPGLLRDHGQTLLLVMVALFCLTSLCFCLVSCTDPGVAGRSLREDGSCEHPGGTYSYSQDSNRYVKDFDHFCDFVGNDIGGKNMPCFVSFLLSIASLAVVLCFGCILYVIDMEIGPPPSWYLDASPWRVTAAVIVFILVLFALSKLAKSEACEGVLPLIMMMPGAKVGVVLLALVVGVVVFAPFVVDMFSDVSLASNPVPVFLVLPLFAFTVLFCGMAMHWVWLLCEGVTQKMFLKAKGWRRKKEPVSTQHLV